MTLYRNGHRVEILAADLTQTPPAIEWAYRPADLETDGGRNIGDSPGGRTQDTHTDAVCRIAADGGYRELMTAVQRLPASRVRGQRVAGKEVTDEC